MKALILNRTLSLGISLLAHAAKRVFLGLGRSDVLIWLPAWVIGVLGLVQGFGRAWSDSVFYVNWARLFSGQDRAAIFYLQTPFDPNTGGSGRAFGHVITATRPVIPFLASLMMSWVNASLSFGSVNSFFWVGGSVLSYYLGKMLISRGFGLACATFYFTSVPMLAYGAAILTDSAAYFFIGLAFYLHLSTRYTRPSSKRIFLEGIVMATSSFVNPACFAAFCYLAAVRCRTRRSSLAFAAGATLILAPAVILLVGTGLLGKTGAFASYVLGLRLAGVRSGPPILDALAYTFNLYAIQLVVPIASAFAVSLNFLFSGYSSSLSISFPAFWFLVFTALIGVVSVPRKRDLFLYAPFLFVYEFVAHATIERYLFVLWPLAIPMILAGLHRVFLVIGRLVSRIVAQVRGGSRPAIINPLFFVALFLDAQAAVNLYYIYPQSFSVLSISDAIALSVATAIVLRTLVACVEVLKRFRATRKSDGRNGTLPSLSIRR